MLLKVQVITQEHQTWPARGEKPAGESYNLICQDMSQPPEHRMAENVTYKLKENEVPEHYNKSMDKTLTVVCKRIVQSKTGKASIIGEIVAEKK
jgi:hypothetical protein